METVLGLPVDGVLDKAVWDAIGGDAAPPCSSSTRSRRRTSPILSLASIPDDYAEQAKLPSLDYTSPEEMFGERFHMDVKLLTRAQSRTPTSARPARRSGWPPSMARRSPRKIARIVADKALKQVRGLRRRRTG